MEACQRRLRPLVELDSHVYADPVDLAHGVVFDDPVMPPCCRDRADLFPGKWTGGLLDYKAFHPEPVKYFGARRACHTRVGEAESAGVHNS